MNGASAYGWLKVALLAVLVFAVAYFGKKILDWLRDPFKHNVVSNAANSAFEKVTGDPSIGGWLADKLNPAAREVNRLYAPVKPVLRPNDLDAELQAGAPRIADAGRAEFLSP
jgi:hypothetical protein